MGLAEPCGSSVKAAVWRWLVRDGILQQCLKTKVSGEKGSSWKANAT